MIVRARYVVSLVLSALAAVASSALAGEVELVGLFGAKAVLSIDGGPPRTLGVGERTREGLLLVGVSDGAATVEIGGRRQKVLLGAGPVRTSSGEDPGGAMVSLIADARGHHFSSGSINGASMRFLVDTGASMVSMGASDARRAGVDYSKGTPAMSSTASGPARVWKVRLDKVKVGDVLLHGVDGVVHENDLPFVLLGMSFLGRMDMQREGDRLVMRKRF